MLGAPAWSHSRLPCVYYWGGCSRTGEGEQAAPAPGSRVCSVVCVHHHSVLLALPGPLHSRLTPVSAPADSLSSPQHPSLGPSSAPRSALSDSANPASCSHHRVWNAPISLLHLSVSPTYRGSKNEKDTVSFSHWTIPCAQLLMVLSMLLLQEWMKCYTLQTAFYQFTMNKINLKIQFLMPCLD